MTDPVARCSFTAHGPHDWLWDFTGGAAAAQPSEAAAADAQIASVHRSADGQVTAAASNTITAGLFWTLDQGDLIISPRLGEVVMARRSPTTFSRAWLVDRLGGTSSPAQTPYAEVRRIPPATVARWDVGRREPVLRQGGLPSSPVLEGPEVLQAYVRNFDHAVQALIPDNEPLCATLSGGLDSTFVVASLTRHAAGRPVHVFVHRPHPDAGLKPIGAWDADEMHVVAAMPAAYPELVVTELINDSAAQPLDVCLRLATDAWVPMANPDNMVWLDQAQMLARDMGSQVLFMGENGNASFSYSHPYASVDAMRHGDLKTLMSLIGADRDKGRSLGAALRHQVAAPLLSRVRQRLKAPAPDPYLGEVSRAPRLTRDTYISWLRADGAIAAFLQPGTEGTRIADPFRAWSVMGLAARISPREWQRGPAGRGFARRAGLGRIPDEIRLRTRRGGQSWDAWFTIRMQRERYVEQARALRRTPVMQELVDVDALEAAILQWPWGQTHGPSPGAVMNVSRLLHLGDFTRMTVRRLAEASASRA